MCLQERLWAWHMINVPIMMFCGWKFEKLRGQFCWVLVLCVFSLCLFVLLFLPIMLILCSFSLLNADRRTMLGHKKFSSTCFGLKWGASQGSFFLFLFLSLYSLLVYTLSMTYSLCDCRRTMSLHIECLFWQLWCSAALSYGYDVLVSSGVFFFLDL